MEEVRRLEAVELWPGFDPAGIPTAFFDGEKTYLFGFDHIVGGFRPAAAPVPHLVHRGIHPDITANRRVLIDGRWTAACVPRMVRTISGRPLTAAEMAAVVVHEKFHVFQALRHPSWRPNDACLLRYPLDSAETLAERRIEMECLRRAAEAGPDGESASWANAALSIRRRRLERLPGEFADYERHLHLLEGLAVYVQARAAGRMDFDPAPAASFAPAAIRELGYLEGWRLAVLLDRFDPRWRDDLEAEAFGSLEERLDEAIGASASRIDLGEEEKRIFRETAEGDWQLQREERGRLLRLFTDPSAIRIEIIAQGEPFRFESFDPFSVDSLTETAVLHWRSLSGRIGRNRIQVNGRPCLTVRNSSGAVRSLILTDFSRRPSIRSVRRAWLARTGRLYFALEGLTVRLENSYLSRRGDTLYIYVR